VIPNLVGQVTEKKQVRIIFHNSTSSAMFVHMCSKPADSFSRRNNLSEKSLGKGFEQGGHWFSFPNFLEDDVSMG
jgi:hypothetical protein